MADTKTTAVDPEKARHLEEDHAPSPPVHDENIDTKGVNGMHKDQGTGEEIRIQWTFARVIAIASLCLVYVGAQEILYFTGGALTYIGFSINSSTPNWLLTANTLAVTAICPFVGYITDLLGRKWIAVFGSLLLVIACIVMGVTKELGSAVTGQAIGGIGAGICELTALAGVAEITPVRWRGVTLSLVTFSIVPFMPYLIYVQQLQEAGSWRWCFLIAGIWNLVGLVGLLFCYRPPPRHNVDGLSRMEIVKRIDYVGAVLSISGVTLFLVGLQAGGYEFPWTSGKVLGPLIVGTLLIMAFSVWEVYGPTYPMVPREIFQGQRVVFLAYVIVFVAGMNFYSILGFFPIMLEYFWGIPPITIGVRALCYPIAILAGACIISFSMSYTRGHVREMFALMAILMTAFGGALAGATPFNWGYAIAMATLDSFGIGGLVVPALTLALYACPDRYIGTTAALSLSVRFLGGSIGTTIFFNIFNTKITKNLPAYIGQAALKAGLPQENLVQFITALTTPVEGPALAAQVPGATQAVLEQSALAARWAFSDSLKDVWYATIPFGIICLIACLCLPNIRRHMSSRIAVDIH